jgi:hypothetical protein
VNTTRMEALGLAAGMSVARDWKGPVERLSGTWIMRAHGVTIHENAALDGV